MSDKIRPRVDETFKPARDLMEAMRGLRTAWDKLRSVRGSMIQQKDGASDYTTIAANFGYAGADAAAKEANAQASFEEIDGNWATVDAKIDQMLCRHL